MTTPLLSLRALRIDRGSRTVLHGLDLDVEPGTVVGLIGPNGSGKTTLLSAVGAGAAVSSGSMHCAGVDLTALRPRARARHVAFVPQQTRLGFDLTVREIVALGTLATGAADNRDRIVDGALRRAGCAHLADRPATRLSGGECQLVHIARALAQNAPILVMDEPTSALDLAHQITVLTLARGHADAVRDDRGGSAVILSLHDLDLAARFCDRLVLLESGRIVAAGSPDEVLDPPRLERVYGVGVRIHHDRTTGSLRVTAFPPPPLTGES
ncbi:ABC transporter ATP-binding protein [Rhodococcus zopfii]|uniref:ABC transporter ATP-binding protein n=1 Tax=Rhodococcus zopfii TaxID=43772 RepID=UPI001486ED52|nr:ATP-binding cassette domain-containing protein [Rhodococcus zopfii]